MRPLFEMFLKYVVTTTTFQKHNIILIKVTSKEVTLDTFMHKRKNDVFRTKYVKNLRRILIFVSHFQPFFCLESRILTKIYDESDKKTKIFFCQCSGVTYYKRVVVIACMI